MRNRAAVRVVGPIQWIVYPALMAMALTFVLAVPIHPFGLDLPEPVPPMLLAFAWPLIRPSVLAAATLFLCGLFLDLLWRGDLAGLWPLVLLLIFGATLAARKLLAGQETVVLFIWYALSVAMGFAVAWLVVLAATGSGPSLVATVWQYIPTILLFPIAAWMVERFADGDVRFR